MQNAAEALAEGHKTLHASIDLTVKLQKSRAQIIIVDNGPGFPEMDLDELIEPYVTTREKGTGLGLSIVQKIVQDHNGRLRLENKPDVGAQVMIELPILELGNV